MIYLQWIITIASAAASIIAMWQIVKKAFKKLIESFGFEDMKEHVKENYLSCLRLTIMSHDMPLGERIIAGEKYIKAGGNGEVKKYVETVLQANERIDK